MADEYTTDPVLAEAHERRMRREQAFTDAKDRQEILKAGREAEVKVQEDRRGLLADTIVGIRRAIPGVAEEAFDLIATLDEAMMANVLDVVPDVRFGIDPRNPEGGLGFFMLSKAETKLFPLPSIARASEKGLRLIKEAQPETERLTGGLAEPIGKFVIGFVTGKKVLKGLNLLQGTGRGAQLANAVVAGAGADAIAFDGHEQRLSDFLITFDNKAMNNAVTQYLASNEDDTELEGRMKNILEGAGLGALFDAFIAGVRGIRAFRTNRAIEKAVKDADDFEFTQLDTPKRSKETQEVVDEIDRIEAKLDDATTPKLSEVEIIAARKTKLQAAVRSTMQITDKQKIAFDKALAAGDEKEAHQILKDFNEDNIDWDAIEDADDIKQVLLATEEVFAELIDASKGGVQSNKQTRMLANLVDATPRQIKNLFRDTRGGGGIAARFYAAQRTMLASANQVKKTAQASLDDPGSNFRQAEALRALQVHAAIQAEVKGAQTEIARAMQAMGLLKESASENYREFGELRRQFAGSGVGKSAWEQQMDAILGTRGLDDLNALTRMTPYERVKNIFIEYTINSMLSSPKTHAVNLISNVLNVFIYSLDRSLGGAYRFLRHGDRQALREARIDVTDKLFRMDEAWKLAKQAWRDGAPVTDKRQRIEFQTRRAISVEGTARDVTAADAGRRELGSPIIARKTEVVTTANGDMVRAVDFNTWQRVINTIGRVIRIPGRALITGDEFFKAVNRNSEISVLAFRQADEEALAKGLTYGSDKYEAFVLKRSKKLADIDVRDPENIRIQSLAIEKSRLTTFQEAPRTTFGSKAEQFVNSNSYFKLIVAPFFRTPMNILRQGAFDRTPIGLLFKHNREILRTGNPRDKAEIVARSFTGIAAMSIFYGLTTSGEEGDRGFEIVGKVPIGTSAKQANIRDYSIRFGDRWFQFNRLEPLGMWLGMIADMRTAAKYNDGDEDEWLFAAGQGAIASFMNNVGGKTFMKSIADIQDMFEGVGTGNKGAIERAISRFAAGEFGKLIPQLLKASARGLEGDGNSFQQEAWTVMDILSARSSLFNENLSQQHDTFGNPISRDAGLSILVNPFAISEHSSDPVDQEMFRLGFSLKKMPKTLGAGGFELSAEEYSTLTGLVARTGLHQTLTAMVTSDAWDKLTDPMKSFLMKERITEARRAARVLFLAEPGIAKRISEEKVAAITLLTSDE